MKGSTGFISFIFPLEIKGLLTGGLTNHVKKNCFKKRIQLVLLGYSILFVVNRGVNTIFPRKSS